MAWAYVIAVGLGLSGVISGILMRAGKVRSFYPIYRAKAAPFYVRNRPFGTIPLGCFFLGFAAFAASVQHGQTAVAAVFFVLTWASFILGIVWMLRPPEFLKPGWLRVRERTEDAEAVAPGGRVPVPRAAYLGLWLLLFVLFLFWWLLDWSWGWFTGLCLGGATLLAYRPIRRG